MSVCNPLTSITVVGKPTITIINNKPLVSITNNKPSATITCTYYELNFWVTQANDNVVTQDGFNIVFNVA